MFEELNNDDHPCRPAAEVEWPVLRIFGPSRKSLGPGQSFGWCRYHVEKDFFFTITITYLSRVADGGLDAVLVVQRVTKAKDEGELMMMMVMMSVMMVVVMVVMVMLMMVMMVILMKVMMVTSILPCCLLGEYTCRVDFRQSPTQYHRFHCQSFYQPRQY